MKTEIQIKSSSEPKKELPIKVGNWYVHDDGELYILVKDHGKETYRLISLYGPQWHHTATIPIDAFAGQEDSFTLVKDLIITYK